MFEIILKYIGIGGLIFTILLIIFLFAGLQIDKIDLAMQLNEKQEMVSDLNLSLMQYRNSIAQLIKGEKISLTDLKMLPDSEKTIIIELLREVNQ